MNSTANSSYRNGTREQRNGIVLASFIENFHTPLVNNSKDEIVDATKFETLLLKSVEKLRLLKVIDEVEFPPHLIPIPPPIVVENRPGIEKTRLFVHNVNPILVYVVWNEEHAQQLLRNGFSELIPRLILPTDTLPEEFTLRALGESTLEMYENEVEHYKARLHSSLLRLDTFRKVTMQRNSRHHTRGSALVSIANDSVVVADDATEMNDISMILGDAPMNNTIIPDQTVEMFDQGSMDCSVDLMLHPPHFSVLQTAGFPSFSRVDQLYAAFEQCCATDKYSPNEVLNYVPLKLWSLDCLSESRMDDFRNRCRVYVAHKLEHTVGGPTMSITRAKGILKSTYKGRSYNVIHIALSCAEGNDVVGNANVSDCVW